MAICSGSPIVPSKVRWARRAKTASRSRLGNRVPKWRTDGAGVHRVDAHRGELGRQSADQALDGAGPGGR